MLRPLVGRISYQPICLFDFMVTSRYLYAQVGRYWFRWVFNPGPDYFAEPDEEGF